MKVVALIYHDLKTILFPLDPGLLQKRQIFSGKLNTHSYSSVNLLGNEIEKLTCIGIFSYQPIYIT